MQYISDKNLATRLEVGRSTIWNWLSKDQFPKPIKLNGSTRWKLTDIEKWEADQQEVSNV